MLYFYFRRRFGSFAALHHLQRQKDRPGLLYVKEKIEKPSPFYGIRGIEKVLSRILIGRKHVLGEQGEY